MKDRPAFLTFLLVALLIVLLCLAFDPRWQTNDDVTMSMAAHGYGLAAYETPQLIFSNVLWGYLVRAIPSINGVLGYSLASMTVLLVGGWAMLYFLIRLGAGYLLGMLAVGLVLLRPTLFPQFSVNAGLLTVAAVIGWQVHARLGRLSSLVIACLLAFSGFLIRDKEFLLVLGVALPLLPWRALREQRQMQIAFILLAIAIASAAVFDHWSYSGPEWQQQMELTKSLGKIIDFGAGKHLKQRPEILAHHGYSQNDIDLINDWFFVDPQIADPKSLNAMLAELGPLPMQEGSVQSAFLAIQALFDLTLLPLFLSGLLLLVLVPRKPLVLAWVLCIAALFAIGLMGRPSALYIFIPLLSLLIVAPLAFGKYTENSRRWLATLTFLLACIAQAYLLMPAAWTYKQWAQQVQKDAQGLPAGLTIVSWGKGFPIELTFPVFANDTNLRKIRLYGLNGVTYAPHSVASTEVAAGRGMLEGLQSPTGISIMASQKQLEMLRIYCLEHLNGQLLGKITYQTSWLFIQQVRCVKEQ